MKCLILNVTVILAIGAMGSCTMVDDLFFPSSVPDRPLPPAPVERPVTENTNRQLDGMRERLNANPQESIQTEQRQLNNQQNQVANNTNVAPTPPAPKPNENKPTAQKKEYPFAVKVPGRPGFVYSPYTNAEINVADIPRGTPVRDPDDPNTDHIFRVP